MHVTLNLDLLRRTTVNTGSKANSGRELFAGCRCDGVDASKRTSPAWSLRRGGWLIQGQESGKLSNSQAYEQPSQTLKFRELVLDSQCLG